VLAGHSSGAHLAAVAALVPRDPAPPCPYPAAKIVGYIGLAGPYDLSSFAEAAEPLLGATLAEDPAAWRAADPLWLGRHPPAGLRVLLVHGSADPVVPPAAGASGRGRGRGDRSATETRDLTTPWAGANDSRSEDLRLCHTGGRLAQIGGEARQRADRDEDQETS
jgi:acetyl esterase/lipase